jgi:hypothetical protein
VTDPALRSEARAFSRYLIGEPPLPPEEERYAAAVRARVARPPDAVVRVARALPLMIGPLDAAAALVDPDGQLRQRLLLAAAVLEASPAHTERFLPRSWSVVEATSLLLRLAVLVPLRLVVGLPALLALKLLRA